MSLILEALRKLEREKLAPGQPGFVVLPTSRWGEGRSPAGLVFAAVFALAVAGALGLGLWMGARRTARVRETLATTAPVTTAAVTPALTPPTSVERPPASAASLPVSPASTLPAQPAMPLLATPELPAAEPAASPVPAGDAALVLTAISARDGRPVAVIDDRLVHEGDEYDGLRIVRIGTDAVEVVYKGEPRTLRFQ